MSSYGKAKTVAVKEPVTPKPAAAGGGAEHLHALHAKMATHLAGLEEHLDGLHEMHSALGAHLGIPSTDNSETDKEG